MSTRIVALSVLVVLIFTAIACSTNPATGESEIILISTEQEIAMGESSAAQFEEQFGGLVPDQNAQNALNEIGQQIAAGSDRSMPYSFGLLASDIPNAFALPGGPIYVTAGFMLLLESDRELAAVLGHEIGHIAARHSVAAMSRQVGWQFLVDYGASLFSNNSELVAMGGTFATGMAELSYSRENEYEADDLGLRYMTRAGYDPDGMAVMLSRLLAMSSGPGSKLDELFKTHPNTEYRVQKVWDTIDAQYQDAPKGGIDPSVEFARIYGAAIWALQ